MVSIDADLWSADQLRSVIEAGEYLLNVKFDEASVAEVLKHSGDSVSLVQEACYRICLTAGVSETVDKNLVVGEGLDVEDLVRGIVNEQAGRYQAFVTNFSEGFQDTELEMYKWLVLPC